ncbi:NAD-binding protein [Microcoleus sp. FACHB-1515]|uniref:NAD-binding protein n=1 Tax=Cyanophyceae TaxID=3028117 RepID=UPI0018EF6E5E|nr:NAD-binding protein [Microcoleus sp. FACHB-1515]
MKALVFLTILMTVLIQGLSAGWIARWLGLQTNQVRVVIAGGNLVSQLLYRLLQQKGESVLLIDLHNSNTSPVQLDDIPAISKYLNLEELEAEGIASLSTFIALTHNPELNGILAQRASELFCPDRVVTLSQPPLNSGDDPSFAATGIQIAFAPQVPLDRWSQYLAENDVQVIEIMLRSTDFETQQAELQAGIKAGDLLPILIERNQRLEIIIADQPWQAGDHITYLLHASSSAEKPLTDVR